MFPIKIAINWVLPPPSHTGRSMAPVKARSDKAAGDFQKYFEVPVTTGTLLIHGCRWHRRWLIIYVLIATELLVTVLMKRGGTWGGDPKGKSWQLLPNQPQALRHWSDSNGYGCGSLAEVPQLQPFGEVLTIGANEMVQVACDCPSPSLSPFNYQSRPGSESLFHRCP